MTPREIAIYADGVNERAREEWRESMRTARLTAWMQRCEPKEFPTLRALGVEPPLTREEQAKENRERMDDLKAARNATIERQEKKKRAAAKAEAKKAK